MGLILTILAAGCIDSDELDEGQVKELPCETRTHYVDLGRPTRSRLPAEVTLSGDTVWVKLNTATGGEGFTPVIDQAALYVGPFDEPPEFDESGNPLSSSVRRFSVHVDVFTEIDLPSGRYWLVQSQGGNLELLACEQAAISDALGVPLDADGVSHSPAEIVKEDS